MHEHAPVCAERAARPKFNDCPPGEGADVTSTSFPNLAYFERWCSQIYNRYHSEYQPPREKNITQYAMQKTCVNYII